jgi:hypothetical protein
MKIWEHTLTPGLVSVLVEAIKFVHRAGKNEFHLQRDLDLSKTAYNNAQKLRYHALIAKIEEKPGYWCITSRGGQFLRGEIRVPAGVKTFRNKVTGHSDEVIHIGELRNKIPVFESQFAYETPERFRILRPATAKLL